MRGIKKEKHLKVLINHGFTLVILKDDEVSVTNLFKSVTVSSK